MRAKYFYTFKDGLVPIEAKRYLIRRVDDTEIFYIVDLINAYYDIKNPVSNWYLQCNVLSTAKNTHNLTKLSDMFNHKDLIMQRNNCSGDKTEQKSNLKFVYYSVK